MLTTVLRAFVSISPTILSSSGNIFQPFLLPRHFLILKDISCEITGLSHLTGLVFLEKYLDWSCQLFSSYLEQIGEAALEQTGEAFLEHAGEAFLESECFSLAALKLACLRNSLLKLL